MAYTLIGKKFESKFAEDFLRTFPNGVCYRLLDTQSRQKGVSNACDFICYAYPYQFMVECKEHKGTLFPFSDLRQYDKLLDYKDKNGVFAGVVLWFSEKDIVIAIHIEDIERMKKDGLKSINLRKLDKELYNIIDIPSEKLMKFMRSDYTVLYNYMENKIGGIE